MQQIFPNPGFVAATDECTLSDFSDAQVAALRKLVLQQLAAQSGDVQGFNANEPPNCRRKQMIYYMKSAVLVAK